MRTEHPSTISEHDCHLCEVIRHLRRDLARTERRSFGFHRGHKAPVELARFERDGHRLRTMVLRVLERFPHVKLETLSRENHIRLIVAPSGPSGFSIPQASQPRLVEVPADIDQAGQSIFEYRSSDGSLWGFVLTIPLEPMTCQPRVSAPSDIELFTGDLSKKTSHPPPPIADEAPATEEVLANERHPGRGFSPPGKGPSVRTGARVARAASVVVGAFRPAQRAVASVDRAVDRSVDRTVTRSWTKTG